MHGTETSVAYHMQQQASTQASGQKKQGFSVPPLAIHPSCSSNSSGDSGDTNGVRISDDG